MELFWPSGAVNMTNQGFRMLFVVLNKHEFNVSVMVELMNCSCLL